MGKIEKVVDFLNRINFMNEYDEEEFPSKVKYKGNIYYLKLDDYAFVGFYTKSGIDLEKRIDPYWIFEDNIEILEWFGKGEIKMSDEELIREAQRKYYKNYYHKNNDKMKKYQNEYRKKNKDKVKEYNKSYWLKKALSMKKENK